MFFLYVSLCYFIQYVILFVPLLNLDQWYQSDLILLRSIPASEISLPFLFSQLVFSISFPSSIPTRIPIFFPPFSFPFIATMLSHFSKKLMGSRVGGLMGLHLHPCFYVMSLTDHLVIKYLTIFATAGSQVQAFIFQVPRSPLCTQRPVIYIMTIRLIMGIDPLSISFLLYPSLTNLFETLNFFFIVRGIVGSRVGEFTKGPKFKLLFFVPAIFVLFPICI
jgi:hypothetical protein